MNKYIYFVFLLISLQIKADDSPQVYIIIHGTWARTSEWYRPLGDFYETLFSEVIKRDKQTKLDFLMWSGSHFHYERVKAADELIKHMHRYDKNTNFTIIAHSHGANVGFIASQKLQADPKNEYTIKHFFSLGCPIDTEEYLPSMETITYLYHIFSLEDLIQPVLGIFNRQCNPHERIANLRLFINGKEPGHSDLHAPIVAQWLLWLCEQFHTKEAASFEPFSLHKPGIIYLADDKNPVYEIDMERETLLEIDQYIFDYIRDSIFRYKRTKYPFNPNAHKKHFSFTATKNDAKTD